MMESKDFKPNLIPNEPKDGSFSKEEREVLIEKNGGIENYIINLKKDGCRLEFGVQDEILTRSLKQPGSLLVRERFKDFQELCLKLNIIVDAEFYMHGMKFNEIFRYFSKSDVTTPKYRKELEGLLKRNPDAFFEKYRSTDIDHLTTFHSGLNAWIFDGIVLDRPELVGYEERMYEIMQRLYPYDNFYIEAYEAFSSKDFKDLDRNYEKSLISGWEGLVLTHKDHPYKFGRSTLKSGTILKLKDDKQEYDGIILEVEEATKAKEGTERTTNELGRSVTSKKKDDREPSGLAKGFVVQYEDVGEFTVSLRGFDNEAKRELLENASKYIGKHFKYTGSIPVKDFPRHAFFDCWRDEK